MSLATQITFTQELQLIADWLTLWATPKGGTVKVMAGMGHLWEEVWNMTLVNDPRVLVVGAGETARGGKNSNTTNRVDRRIVIVILRGHGFVNAVVDTDQGVEPFLDTIEQLRDKVRVMLNISDEEEVPSVVYKGFSMLDSVSAPRPTQIFLDGARLEFTTGNDIPAISLTPQ